MHEMHKPEVNQIQEETPNEVLTTSPNLMTTLSACKSRRSLLRGSAGLAMAGMTAALTVTDAFTHTAHAQVIDDGLDLKKYFSILATGEMLFATFYRLGVQNSEQLGFSQRQVIALKAIWAEEEFHLQFAKAHGGTPATTQFSFPDGAKTFEDLDTFLKTQQLAEELTNGALLAWINDMAASGNTRLAQIGGQLMQVEGGHRVVGRVIMAEGNPKRNINPNPDGNPFANWAFGPVAQLNNKNIKFTDVPTVVTNHGFLSPKDNNSFSYKAPEENDFRGITIANAVLPTF